MDARRPIERLLAELRRGHEQEALHRPCLDPRKRELLGLEVRADLAQRVVPAGIEDYQLVTGWLGRRHDALENHAVGHGASRAIQLGVDRREDVALLRCQAVASEEHEGEIRTRRALLQSSLVRREIELGRGQSTRVPCHHRQ